MNADVNMITETWQRCDLRHPTWILVEYDMRQV